jgi:amidohydrolase
MYSRILNCLTILCFPILLKAQISKAVIDAKATAINNKLIEWRRHLHQHPELGNREFNTAKYITAHLKKLGLDVVTNVAFTGVVATLKGGKPGPVIALRADIDALPVFERNQLSFKSKDSAIYNNSKVAVMHACGHDSHTAILMATAEVLKSMQKDIAGTVKFIFQPAEEGAPEGEEGGAKLMVKQGVMENPKVDVIFGLHINSLQDNGVVYYKSGAFMASADWFTINVKGKGAHGSAPWLGVDPINVSSQIISNLQSIVGRQMDLTKAPTVITVGKINGGVRENIIPEYCTFGGTIRTLDSADQIKVHERIKTLATNIAEANGAVAEITIETKTLVTFNTPWLVEKCLPIMQNAIGKEKVKPMEWTTGAEDFSYYGEKAPAFFFNLGARQNGVTKEKAGGHHTPDFYIEDDKLYEGVKVFCNLVFEYPKVK